MAKVITRSHNLNGAQLELKPYCPFLPKPAYVPANRVLEKEIPVESQVMQFICEQRKADLTHIQNKHDVKVTWKEGAKSITLTTAHSKSVDKHRFEDASKAICSLLKEFRTCTTSTTSVAWQTLVEQFKEIVSSVQQDIKIQYLNQQHKIVLTGVTQHVEPLDERLKHLKTDIENQLAVEESKISIIAGDIPKKRLELLGDLDFDKELEVQYQHTKVDIIADKGQVRIRGPSKTVHKVEADIRGAVGKMKQVRSEVPQNAVELLRERPCQLFIQQQFTANKLLALVNFQADDEEEFLGAFLIVTALDSGVAHRASSLLKKIIVEKNIRLDDDQLQLERSEEWRLLRDELIRNNILSIKFDKTENKLCLAGRKEHVKSACRRVMSFFKKDIIVSDFVKFPRGCERLVEYNRERDLPYRPKELNKSSKDTSEVAPLIGHITDGEQVSYILFHASTCYLF